MDFRKFWVELVFYVAVLLGLNCFAFGTLSQALIKELFVKSSLMILKSFEWFWFILFLLL